MASSVASSARMAYQWSSDADDNQVTLCGLSVTGALLRIRSNMGSKE